MLARVLASLRRHYLGAVAIFLALGGTAFAAVDLGANSVGSRELQPNSVTGQKIRTGAIDSDDIQDREVHLRDINGRAIKRLRGRRGRRGAAGRPGAAGPQGQRGPQGAAGSPDRPQQVLEKLKTVDGAGSGLDAELLEGVPLDSLQRRVTGTCPAGQYLQSIDALGGVGCGADATLPPVPLRLEQASAGSTDEVLRLTQQGLGNTLEIRSPNAGNGGRAIDVTQSGGGPGVFATSAAGSGVWGVTSSISAAGVIGDNVRGEAVVGRAGSACTTAPLDTCQGIGAVVGRNDGPLGYGVRGFTTDPDDGFGVIGQAGISGGTGAGVRGENINPANPDNGVEAVTNGAGSALFAQGTQAGTFNGAVTINGDLTVTGTKSGFHIDHPRNPSNRTLSHTPVETDELVVSYSGNVRTDARGRARVPLPSYATAIAGRWRYTLTPIGSFAEAIVEREVGRGGIFTVRTDKPRIKVSWSVTGTRKDPYARRHPFKAERSKRGKQRGRFLHPGYFGKSASSAAVPRLRPTMDPRGRLASDAPARRR